jgi:hypothetical protein
MDGPGLYLQGLATYGPAGEALPGPSLQPDIVQLCFEYSETSSVACLAFLGDTCVSTSMDPCLEELHTRYYEPLAEVCCLLVLPNECNSRHTACCSVTSGKLWDHVVELVLQSIVCHLQI